MGWLFLYNYNISAFKQINNFTSIDSIIQIQDSLIHKVWEIKNKSISTTNILTSPNLIYSISDSGLVYCYDFAGKEKWAVEVLGVTTNNSVLYKDLLLLATAEGDLYSINSNNGEVLQVVGIGENITSDLALVEIATANSKTICAVFGTSEGNIFCYDAFTFESLWENNACKNPILSAPLIVNEKVIFLSSYSSLYSFKAQSGSLIWKYEFSDKQNSSIKNYPLSDDKNIFSLTSDGNLIAVDLLLGKKIWSTNKKGVLNQFYISSDKLKLFLIDGKGIMTVYSTKNGKEIGKNDFKKSELFSFIIAENLENTFIGFSDGSLYTFNSKFVIKELISPTQIPITSINVITNDEFIIKDINGRITFYKINLGK